jgi:predicted small secreted protein
MKRFISALLPLVLLTAACNTTGDGEPILSTPVRVPDLPPELNVKAERLPDITDNTMGGLVLDGDATDKAYNKVAHNNNNLIDFYNCVKDAINLKQPLAKCLGTNGTE